MSPKLQTNSPFVCHCLRITEDDVLDAHQECPFRSLDEIRQRTGAGQGCTACCRKLEKLVVGGSTL